MSQGSKPLEYTPSSHQTSFTKHKIKDKIIMSFQAATMEPCWMWGSVPLAHVACPRSRSFPVLQKWLWEGTKLNITEASLKGRRAGDGTLYGHEVDSIYQKFPEGRKSRENQPPVLPFFPPFSNKSGRGRFTLSYRSDRYYIWPWETGRENG